MNITLKLDAPNEKQKNFFLERHKYVAFGGARGGGKSWAVRVKALLLCLKYPGIRVMIVRRSYPELRENHIKLLRGTIPKSIAVYNETKKEFSFINGSLILFRYCSGEAAVNNFQGMEVDALFIDEATQFSFEVFRKLSVCVRGVNGFPKRVYLTCNPGGIGHGWIKRLFIDRDYTPGENGDEYSFIKSLVTDNRALMESQPDYVRQLETLPEKLKRAWLYGEWNILDGQFFDEFTNDPVHYADRRFTHVIDPFDPPKEWRRYRSFDFGYARPFSCGWWAVSPEGVLYRILELYGCTKETNEGVRWTPDRIFSEIALVEKTHPYLKGCEIQGVADPSIWDASRGESVADAAARHGIYFAPGDNARIAGWMQVHYRLSMDETGMPLMQIFKGCKDAVRTFPLLCHSNTNKEDLDSSAEDHIADEVRYLCMSRPVTLRPLSEKKRPAADPLDLLKNEEPCGLDIYEI